VRAGADARGIDIFSGISWGKLSTLKGTKTGNCWKDGKGLISIFNALHRMIGS
jgi:hypothetical protein